MQKLAEKDLVQGTGAPQNDELDSLVLQAIGDPEQDGLLRQSRKLTSEAPNRVVIGACRFG